MVIKLCLIYLKLMLINNNINNNMNNNILNEIKLVRKYIQRPEIIQLYKTNKKEYEDNLNDKFKNFSENKPFLFDMIIRYEKFDYNKLNNFLGVINNIKGGKISNEDASKMIGQMQYDEYVKNKIDDEKVSENNKSDDEKVSENNKSDSMQNERKKIDTNLKYI